TTGIADIDLALLESIHAQVDVPLVIHGGTGFPNDLVSAAIDRGVAKFNIGTRLKQAYLEGISEAIGSLPTHLSIHRVIGSREPEDILMHGKAKLKSVIAQYMRLYGTVGRARNW
ncbi:MAG TPA: class II fructose-bisphosphate aldolase, partial [Anaerolineae bacterium]